MQPTIGKYMSPNTTGTIDCKTWNYAGVNISRTLNRMVGEGVLKTNPDLKNWFK